MPHGFSKRWNPRFLQRLKVAISNSIPLNRTRVGTVVRGLTMPDIRTVRIGSGRRMTASVLFFDLEDFTSVTADLTTEQTLYILNLIIPTVMHLTSHWNGVVEKNTGDGLMAIFGTETRDESEIANASFECAMAIKYVMVNELGPLFDSQQLPKLAFRIGIDMGEIVIARIGTNTTSFLTAVGSAANRAAKLQSLAQRNGICIGDNMFRNLPSWVDEDCMRGQDPSWNWVYSDDDSTPYSFYHFTGQLPHPRNWIGV